MREKLNGDRCGLQELVVQAEPLQQFRGNNRALVARLPIPAQQMFSVKQPVEDLACP